MAYTWTKSVSWSAGTDPDCATAIYALKVALVAAGWTVPSSGTGTGGSYSSNSDLITSASVLNAARAWFRIASPAGAPGREWCFQRDTTYKMYWRIKYTPSAGFVTGSPANNVTPTAAIECVMVGAGTDASPTMGYAFGLYGGTVCPYVAHIVADNAAPYGFAMWGYRTDTWATLVRFVMDPLLADTYPATDPDPYVIHCEQWNGGYGWDYRSINCDNYTANLYGGQWACFGTPAASANYKNVCMPSMRVYNNAYVTVPRNIGTNPYSIKDEAPRALYARRSGCTSPTGYKGVSSMFRLGTTYRSLGETGTYSTSRDFIRCGDVWIPWDGNAGVT